MGLIIGLLTLPLAPVRGTIWLAERIQEQASSSSRSCAAPARSMKTSSPKPRTRLSSACWQFAATGQ
jgi:hypothetical protein